MTAIPLGASAVVRADSEEGPIPLENRYFESNPANLIDQVGLLSRPGFKKFLSVGSSPINQIFQQPGAFNNAFFFTMANNLYRCTTTESVSLIGTTLNTTFGANGKISHRMASTAQLGSTPAYLYVADGANLYRFGEADSLMSQVAMPNGEAVIDVCFVSGYIIILVAESQGENGRFYWIEPGAIVVQPLNFATAERSPDPAYNLQVMDDQFLIMGASTTEIWYPTGDFSTPFRRLQGRTFNRGIWPGSPLKVKDDVMMIDTDGVVYSMAGTPTRVSNNSIEEQIRKSFAYQKSNNVVLRTWGFSVDGHDFYVIYLPSQATLVYDLSTQSWSAWKSVGSNYLYQHCGINWQGMASTTYGRGQASNIVAGDLRSGQLWLVDPKLGYDQNLTTGNPEAFTCRVTGGVVQRARQNTAVNAVYLTMSLGSPKIAGATVDLQSSDDVGKTWMDHGVKTVTSGDYTQEFAWRSIGLIQPPGKIFQVIDSGGAIRIDGLDMK